MSNSRNIRVVIFREGDSFIASAVEVDVAVQAGSIEEAKRRLAIALHAEADEAQSIGRDLFDLDPAPEMIRQMYEGPSNGSVTRHEMAA